jgi:hypothetical protein
MGRVNFSFRTLVAVSHVDFIFPFMVFFTPYNTGFYFSPNMVSRMQLFIISPAAIYQNVARLFSQVSARRVSVVFLPNRITLIHPCYAVH